MFFWIIDEDFFPLKTAKLLPSSWTTPTYTFLLQSPNMSQLAEWLTAVTGPSCLGGHACQSLCSIANAPPLTSGDAAAAPPPAHFSSQDPASNWLMGCTRLQPEPLKCARCGTRSAPLWRREATGGHLCNGCGLQERSDDRPLLRPKRRAVRATNTQALPHTYTHTQPGGDCVAVPSARVPAASKPMCDVRDVHHQPVEEEPRRPARL